MSAKRINTLGLSLRSQPTRSSRLLRILHAGDEVEVISGIVEDRWVEVTYTTPTGNQLIGFVVAEHLRDPISPQKEELVSNAVKEWKRFKQGEGDENESPFFRFVGQMWRSIGLNLDGRSRDNQGRQIPWSAAFISFIMRNSGYNRFVFSASHANYIRDAIERRINNDTDAPFWAFRIRERRPQVGDLVCKWRGRARTLDQILSHEHFPSHGDVVVAASDDRIQIVGGNVSDSVRGKTIFLDGDGFIDTNRSGQLSFFTVLRNNS